MLLASTRRTKVGGLVNWARCVALDTCGAPLGKARSVEQANSSRTPEVATLAEKEFGKTEFWAAGRKVYWEEVRFRLVASLGIPGKRLWLALKSCAHQP